MLKFLLTLPVLKRLVPSILKKFSFKEISYKYDDVHFNLDLRYLVDRRFFLYGYDVKNIEILNKYIQSYETGYFLDIGSCWGLYSLQIAKKNPRIKVLSFDVFEQNINRIKKMSLKNNVQNIETYNIAVGSEESEVEFSVDEKFSHIPQLVSLRIPYLNIPLNNNMRVERITKFKNDLQRSGYFQYVELDYVEESLGNVSDIAYLDGSLWGLKNFGQNGGK